MNDRRIVEGNRFRHCFERASERYGLTITRRDLLNIELWIVEHCPRIFEAKTEVGVMIPFQGQKVVVGFNPVEGKVKTFLPPRDELFKGQKVVNLIQDSHYRDDE